MRLSQNSSKLHGTLHINRQLPFLGLIGVHFLHEWENQLTVGLCSEDKCCLSPNHPITFEKIDFFAQAQTYVFSLFSKSMSPCNYRFQVKLLKVLLSALSQPVSRVNDIQETLFVESKQRETPAVQSLGAECKTMIYSFS